MLRSPNRDTLITTAKRLGPLLQLVVFVGGQTTELLVTEHGIVPIRATDDVDVVVRVATRTQFDSFTRELRDLGFRHDTAEGAPICRFLADDNLILDVLPTVAGILGFSNQWYGQIVDAAVTADLGDGVAIRIPPAPLFLASKWAAYADRGREDVLGSRDVEDIIAIVAGRPTIVDEVLASFHDVQEYLARMTHHFLRDDRAEDAIYGAIPASGRSPEPVGWTLDRFRMIARS